MPGIHDINTTEGKLLGNPGKRVSYRYPIPQDTRIAYNYAAFTLIKRIAYMITYTKMLTAATQSQPLHLQFLEEMFSTFKFEKRDDQPVVNLLFSTFQSTEAGFQVFHPTSWKPKEAVSPMVAHYEFLAKDFNLSMFATVETFGKGIDANKYEDLLKLQLSKSGIDFQTAPASLGIYPATQYTYKTDRGQIAQTFTIKGNKVYTLNFSIKAAKHEPLKALFQRIQDSFTFELTPKANIKSIYEDLEHKFSIQFNEKKFIVQHEPMLGSVFNLVDPENTSLTVTAKNSTKSLTSITDDIEASLRPTVNEIGIQMARLGRREARKITCKCVAQQNALVTQIFYITCTGSMAYIICATVDDEIFSSEWKHIEPIISSFEDLSFKDKK